MWWKAARRLRVGIKKNLNWNPRIQSQFLRGCVWISRSKLLSIQFFFHSFFLSSHRRKRWSNEAKVCQKRVLQRKGGKPEVLSVAIIAKLIIPEYGDDKKKKKRKKGGQESVRVSRPTREPVIPSRHGPQKQWRSLEILYVSATFPVKGGRKELAELKGTMFNPTLQPPVVESFDEV